MLSYYPILIFIAPLIAGLISSVLGDLIGRKVHRIGIAAQMVALVVSLQVLHSVVTNGTITLDLSLFPSAASGIFQFGFYIDRLSALMMVHISAVSTIIFVFSIRYMQQDRRYAWFLSLLSLTTFVLLCMISSSNLLMLFFFWQLLSWLLSLLSFNYSDPPTVKSAFRTFVMLRFGDMTFLLGILLAYRLYGTLDYQQLFLMAASVQSTFSLIPGGWFQIGGATAVTLLIFVGGMSKSAQFPLHMWLPDFLSAPTPVSALLHAGIINAGGFLLNRLAPLYGLSPTTLHLVFAVGVLTALLGAGMMLTQNDIKKTLGYSTMGQMGYMIMECGLGAFALAIFHLIAHGLFKATFFLNCGNVIHATRLDPRFPLKTKTEEEQNFLILPWLTGFITTLTLPLIILLAAHGVLGLPLRNAQGVEIFLFFSWVTSSQAILSLYRLRVVASRKVAALMLLTLLLVVMTYLLVAEAFTHFLYPDPGSVAAYFQAAALPGTLFDIIIAMTALAVILNWAFIYAKSHGKSLQIPAWTNDLEIRLYLFFINRLYMDALALRLRKTCSDTLNGLEENRFFPYISAFIALGITLPVMGWPGNFSALDMTTFFFAAIMIPLFPLQGLYVAVVTRLPLFFGLLLSILMPFVGMYVLSGVFPRIPKEFLSGVSILGLFGMLYGSLRALAQVKVRPLLGFAGLTSFSFTWWHLSVTKDFTPQAVVYTSAVAFSIGGLLLSWQLLQARYGDLDLNRLSGLAGPMPRFAALMALLLMSAIGLPPFGFFSGYMAMLFHSSIHSTWSLVWVLLVWLASAWYLLRLMQGLLFGPYRSDLPYEDLRLVEALPLLIILIILFSIGILPYQYFESDTVKNGYKSAMESLLWMR